MSVPEYVVTKYYLNEWATCRRTPSGSLRRVVSIDLPLCDTRLEALVNMAFWLHGKAVAGPLVDRAAYREQLAWVKGEIVEAGGTPHPRDTGWAYGIEGYGAEREQRARERAGT